MQGSLAAETSAAAGRSRPPDWELRLSAIGCIFGLLLILLILVDGFETMVLPRRVMRSVRLARYYYRATWRPFRWLALHLPPGKRRETLLSIFGPASILGLFVAWVVGLTIGFAVIQWSIGGPLNMNPPAAKAGFSTYLYMSGVTLFTLGFGDVTPINAVGRMLAVIEAGIGFGFLAVIIGYLPVLYTSFSARELQVALLDARAGSPPTAGQLLLRVARSSHTPELDPFLAQWEAWSAQLLETSLSFPVVCFYRSQHDNESWLAGLAAILDTCAVIATGIQGIDSYQARLTFAMSRHALVDLALVFKTPPCELCDDRLPTATYARLRAMLAEAGMVLADGPEAERALRELRSTYEPFLQALGDFFVYKVPPFMTEGRTVDNWQTSAWTRRVAHLEELGGAPVDEHFA
jgi:hypothetical protein